MKIEAFVLLASLSACYCAAIQHLTPTSTSTPPAPIKRLNCSSVHYDAAGSQVHLLLNQVSAEGIAPPTFNPGANCSDPDSPSIEVTRPGLEHYWRNHIIIGCTVAAAIEVVIVVLIVFYWKQIRWTLRKIICPCTLRHEQQDVTERDSSPPSDNELNAYITQHSQTHDSDEEMFATGLDQRSGVMEYDELVSRDSSMDATSIDTARRHHFLNRVVRPDCISNPSAINYFPYPSDPSGSCTTEEYAITGPNPVELEAEVPEERL
ncbi:hypothetical protein CAPTEDRAFT_200347 [Capitella teleta]|uniref:Uncharacterized protein n=1 Tax=Capitella teleta TaxID=283909 RepID=R7UZV1_CAPTE|nr:hypothetical protein CAPTEDRAFT_200347 [Capitella teleta]|eukprot:ELU09477.1 hypothetical protein CAPTEDRAFT_200347 [Capitella teleta]